MVGLMTISLWSKGLCFLLRGSLCVMALTIDGLDLGFGTLFIFPFSIFSSLLLLLLLLDEEEDDELLEELLLLLLLEEDEEDEDDDDELDTD